MIMAMKPSQQDRKYWNEDAPRSMNARSYAALKPDSRCTCSECGWRGKDYDLKPPCSLQDRLGEGDTMWAGDCPRCDASVFSDWMDALLENERKQVKLAGRMLATLQKIVAEAPNADPGDEEWESAEHAFGCGAKTAYWEIAELARAVIKAAEDAGIKPSAEG